MPTNKISLDERLERLGNGSASDPDYIVCILKKLAQMPLEVYMSGCEVPYSRLQQIVRLQRDAPPLTYQQMATLIVQLAHQNVPHSKECAYQLSGYLSKPLWQYYEERKHLYEKDK